MVSIPLLPSTADSNSFYPSWLNPVTHIRIYTFVPTTHLGIPAAPMTSSSRDIQHVRVFQHYQIHERILFYL